MKKTLILTAAVMLLMPVSLSAQFFRSEDRKPEFERGVAKTNTTYETVSVQQPKKDKKIKNIIVMIGDGMGLEQISCAWALNGGRLNLDNCVYTGFSKTYSSNTLVTDSAAGGTALATGSKTNNGYVAVAPDGSNLESSMAKAKALGKKTGICVTCRTDDATPASFAAHSQDRGLGEYIAAQYLDIDIDFLTGGGRKNWDKRKDGRNIIEEMKAKGYEFVETKDELMAAGTGKVLGLFADGDFAPSAVRGDFLPECVEMAIRNLNTDNKKGFFLMVEGSNIDHECHGNNIKGTVDDLFEFDRAVGKALEFAAKDGNTLVVITADHATGGLTLLGGTNVLDDKAETEGRSIRVNFSTGGHNGIVVPVFAFGPHASEFTGSHENCEIGQLIKNLVR